MLGHPYSVTDYYAETTFRHQLINYLEAIGFEVERDFVGVQTGEACGYIAASATLAIRDAGYPGMRMGCLGALAHLCHGQCESVVEEGNILLGLHAG